MTEIKIDDATRAARKRHTIFVAVTLAIVLLVLVFAHAVLLPFIIALVLAYLLTPLVAWVERKKVPRPLAIILVYVVVLGSLGTFIRFAAPRVGQELGALRREVPVLAKTVRTEWVPYVQERLRSVGLGGPVEPKPESPPVQTPEIVARPQPDGTIAIDLEGPIVVNPRKNGGFVVEPLKDKRAEAFDVDKMVAEGLGNSLAYAQHNTLEIVKIGRDIIAGVSRVFFVFGITLMLAAYMMLTREKIVGFFESLVRPSSRASWRELLARVDRGLSGVVRGQMVICLVNGVLSAIGFAIVGLKYWPVLALVATILSLIPIFGSIVSSVPAVALGLTQSVGTAVFVLIWIIGIHQLEANLLNPKIMGDAAKIHPVLIVFSLLVGEHFFGVMGALLAVPVMSIAQSVFLHVRKNLQANDPEMAHERAPESLIPPAPKSKPAPS
jgi:predicted PurR-regulated permease PerM